MSYDYLLVGSGLFSAVFSAEAIKRKKTCLVIDKRPHIGGNVYTEKLHGITVHQYGPHIFHTGKKGIWQYINQFAEFNHFVNSPVANFHGQMYNLPFNMNTFSQIWPDVTASEQAKRRIAEQSSSMAGKTPQNLEEQAIALVGTDIYEKLIKGYTEKQWGRSCAKLPSSIIKRLPLRFTYNNNYFSDPCQGMPIGGYTPIIEKMLQGCDVQVSADYFSDRNYFSKSAGTVIYTGMIDEYYDYCFGELEYRSLHFDTEELAVENFQGNAVVNYTDEETPYTRIIEHKHFEFGTQPNTVITHEYPVAWKHGDEPYYPINDEKNSVLYQKYADRASNEKHILFGGRLGMYAYLDMDDTIAAALSLAKRVL
ncbi:UDP-galactopyranose mutase [Treponema primitia]|uniref:UDP-galactopyranose mutase n=1 Tax=Treponema primitia TaxID=88058 RepID=UPI000255556D|nr:UDP-galactopyranose mutase [Treponema primitia]